MAGTHSMHLAVCEIVIVVFFYKLQLDQGSQARGILNDIILVTEHGLAFMSENIFDLKCFLHWP